VNHPNVQVVLASKFGLNLLSRSEILFLDGTFRTTECKLVLTILLGFYEGVAVPCAFFLSDLRDTLTYATFFQVLTSGPRNTSLANIHYSFRQLRRRLVAILRPSTVCLILKRLWQRDFAKPSRTSPFSTTSSTSFKPT
jgi:hypothetical protein